MAATSTCTRKTGLAIPSRSRAQGDLTARLKINLWGDDGGTTAFGLLPYLKFPTSTDSLGNNAVEGGLILPFAVNLPYDFGPEFGDGCQLHKECDQ